MLDEHSRSSRLRGGVVLAGAALALISLLAFLIMILDLFLAVGDRSIVWGPRSLTFWTVVAVAIGGGGVSLGLRRLYRVVEKGSMRQDR